MKPLQPKHLWLTLGLAAAGLVAGSLILTAWLDLHPCHLCIFQRLLFMKLAVLGLLAYFLIGGWQRLAGALTLPLSAVGLGVATYQSWLQAQPPGSISCVGGEPGLIERLVEWLGQQLPELFLATGFCEEAELSILGLSLANWALLSFAAFFLIALWALFKSSIKQP
jgi:disulfide bond formation protein DsbB